MTQDEAKTLVAKRAVEFVHDGMAIGLGTGTTATLFIRELALRRLDIRCVASSAASHGLAQALGMHVTTLDELPELDLYIDGADEICAGFCAGRDAASGLDLIKGGGGALLREKIVASAAREFLVVADSSKLVTMLGRFPLPVEVVKMALPIVEPKLAALGFTPKLRPAVAGSGPYLTDEGNYILDCWSTGIAEPESIAAEIRSIVGVVEHGLFLGMGTRALVGGENGVQELSA
ncbi:MAG TPA: ribose-5-phosphate isomerase RpiA [Acidobacteriaceae bacterium]|nr:ribose-5-phosphate isomerase RpiA [Acidobacteriaceae bacterium]